MSHDKRERLARRAAAGDAPAARALVAMLEGHPQARSADYARVELEATLWNDDDPHWVATYFWSDPAAPGAMNGRIPSRPHSSPESAVSEALEVAWIIDAIPKGKRPNLEKGTDWETSLPWPEVAARIAERFDLVVARPLIGGAGGTTTGLGGAMTVRSGSGGGGAGAEGPLPVGGNLPTILSGSGGGGGGGASSGDGRLENIALQNFIQQQFLASEQVIAAQQQALQQYMALQSCEECKSLSCCCANEGLTPERGL